jgi:hypothetical protein
MIGSKILLLPPRRGDGASGGDALKWQLSCILAIPGSPMFGRSGAWAAEQIGADVDIDDLVGVCSPAGDLADNDPGPASDFQHHLVRADVHQVQQAFHHRQVIRAAALFEDTDDAEKRPAEADRAISRAQSRDQRIPLRWRQRERHQDERRAAATNSVGDPADLAFRFGQSDRRERMAIEKVEHCCTDFRASIGDDVRPR